METIKYIEEQIKRLDNRLDPKNPLKQGTRLFLWNEREMWKKLLYNYNKHVMVQA